MGAVQAYMLINGCRTPITWEKEIYSDVAVYVEDGKIKLKLERDTEITLSREDLRLITELLDAYERVAV